VTAFLANVGVNASHSARSPLRADGSFDLLPIPERVPWSEPMLRPADLPGLSFPRTWAGRALHVDPDLLGEPPTYGDNCRRAGRAFALRQARTGDLIAFLARLHPEAGQGGAPPAFYLVGALEVEDVRPDLTAEPGQGWWDGNAHVRRARATGVWDSFWVFKGTSRSGLLRAAVPFTRKDADALLEPSWRSTRTDLQTIGSCTRAVRRLEGRREALLRELCA
jgi:putative DNA base modification enzyme with NMAD domain